MRLPDVPRPPAAPRRPAAHVAHGDIRPDDWQWLANRDDPEVIAYLEAENAYADAVLSPTDALRENLFERIRSRVAETDISTPVFHQGWWYWSRTLAGKQYPVHCRRADPGLSLSVTEVLAARASGAARGRRSGGRHPGPHS